MLGKIHRYYQRRSASFVFRRPVSIDLQRPLISFTFDDFPRSSVSAGGAILNRFGLAGTYYACFGLQGKQAPTGQMFILDDVRTLLDQGHELGCHTFSHCHSSETDVTPLEDSILQTTETLGK